MSVLDGFKHSLYNLMANAVRKMLAHRPVLKVRLQDRSGSMSMASCFSLLPAAARLYALSIF